MARRHARSTRLLTGLLALSLVAACSDGGADDADDAVGPTSPAEAPPAASISTDPTAGGAANVPTDTADLPPVTPLDTSDLPPITPLDTSDLPVADQAPVEGCPAGDWYASQDELQAFYDTVGARAGVAFVFRGDATLQLREDGTLSYVLEDFLLMQEAGGTRVDVRLTGTIDGSYSVSGSVLRTSGIRSNLTTDAFVDDEPMEAGALTDSFVSQFPFSDATYQCVGDDLVMDVPVLGTTHALTLTPAPA
jgi:hypothetical protein